MARDDRSTRIVPTRIVPTRTQSQGVSTNRILVMAGLLSMAVLSGGCFGMDLGLDELFGGTETSGNLRVRSASLDGAISEVGVRGNASAIDAWSDDYLTEVSTTVESGAGAVMTVVEVDGPLPEVRPGETVTIYDTRRGTVGAVDVSVLGCSGPETGMWDYDGYADRATVHVERRYENPRVLRYSYVAEFSEWDGSVSVMNGVFEVEERN